MSMGDDSIDTATWDKLGLKDKDVQAAPPAAGAALDQEVCQVVVGSNETGFNQYGSNMTMSLDIDKGVSASCDSEGRSTLVSPVVALVDASGAVASPPKVVTGSGGGVLKPQKKTAGRKPPVVAPAGTPEVRASVSVRRTVVLALASPGRLAGDTPSVISPPPPDALRVEVAKVAPIPTARRSKAVASPATQERTSSRPKGAKGNMPSLQRAQLLQAQKNLEIEGNPMPRFTIFEDYPDECLRGILADSGVAMADEGEAQEVLSLIRAKEIAQAALAKAAQARAAPVAKEAGAPLVPGVRPEQEDQVAGAAPSSPNRRPAKTRRVAKAVTARGIRLRNRII